MLVRVPGPLPAVGKDTESQRLHPAHTHRREWQQDLGLAFRLGRRQSPGMGSPALTPHPPALQHSKYLSSDTGTEETPASPVSGPMPTDVKGPPGSEWLLERKWTRLGPLNKRWISRAPRTSAENIISVQDPRVRTSARPHNGQLFHSAPLATRWHIPSWPRIEN